MPGSAPALSAERAVRAVTRATSMRPHPHSPPTVLLTAFEFNDFGVASSISWLLFGVVVVLTVATNYLFKERADIAPKKVAQ